MAELLLGAGNRREKKLYRQGQQFFVDLTTLDIDPGCCPDVLWDLNVRPLPFADGQFDEVHAYEVLEHVGRQGDWRGFFAEFAEYYRILKPGGVLVLSCPRWDSPWAWGDPGHTRVLSAHTFTFLSREQYIAQIGQTPMTDYRAVWSGDFVLVHESEVGEHGMLYALQRD
jgi:SAM-dependent methyltransferase